MPAREEIFKENTRRMRTFNRNWAVRLYWQPEPKMPVLPRLLNADGIDRVYEPKRLPLVREPLPADQNPEPVGAGPDENMYYEVNGPDYHEPGWIFQTMKEGKTFVMVETPDEDGGMVKKWLQVA